MVRSPNSGTASEVGGMISARRRKNTVRESRMEMHKVTLWWNISMMDRWIEAGFSLSSASTVSTSRRKNTVRDGRMEMHRVTLWWKKEMMYMMSMVDLMDT